MPEHIRNDDHKRSLPDQATGGLSFVTTGDGSKTIWNPQIGENYHSRHGALQESIHVFLNSGLRYFLDVNGGKSVSVLEVGLGTGLNFLVSANFCTDHQIRLEHTGIEAYPLGTDMVAQTGYDQYVANRVWENFQSWYPSSINHLVQVNEFCQLKTAHCQLMEFESAELYDVVYFDAFAAIHQPEMWSEQAIAHTVKFLKPGGVFVTYAITGNLKRMLKALGFKVEKAPGAPGKREMLRAVRS